MILHSGYAASSTEQDCDALDVMATFVVRTGGVCLTRGVAAEARVPVEINSGRQLSVEDAIVEGLPYHERQSPFRAAKPVDDTHHGQIQRQRLLTATFLVLRRLLARFREVPGS